MKSVVVIKTGQFETFVQDFGSTFSLGDVLRTTSLLRAFDETKSVFWLTQPNAVPLLPILHNLYVSSFDLKELHSLITTYTPLVINLERNFQLVPLIDQNWIGYIHKMKDGF